jgi:hypothetical protein
MFSSKMNWLDQALVAVVLAALPVLALAAGPLFA